MEPTTSMEQLKTQLAIQETKLMHLEEVIVEVRKSTEKQTEILQKISTQLATHNTVVKVVTYIATAIVGAISVVATYLGLKP